MNIKAILSVLTAGLCLAAPARAQTQNDPKAEYNCMHGTPADAGEFAGNMRRIQKVMDAYFALTSTATPKQVRAVFYDDDYVTWQDGDQYVPLDQVASHLAPPVEPPRLVVAVHGGDAWSTRTIWSGRDAKGPVFYVADMRSGGALANAAILRMQVIHGEAPPETPRAYCHVSRGKPYSGNLDDK
jgi:hypothetical protein